MWYKCQVHMFRRQKKANNLVLKFLVCGYIPKSHPHDVSVLPTRLWYPTECSGASHVATPTTAWVPRCLVDQHTSQACSPLANPTRPRMQSVLCATGCLWNVSLSSSLTKILRERSSAFQPCFSCVSRSAGGMSSKRSSRAGRWNSYTSKRLRDVPYAKV